MTEAGESVTPTTPMPQLESGAVAVLTPADPVPSTPQNGSGPSGGDTRYWLARAELTDGGRDVYDSQLGLALVSELIATHRQRQALVRAEGSLARQIKSIARTLGEDSPAAELAALPFIEARVGLHVSKLAAERQMRAAVRQLPIYAFIADVPGFGDIGLAQIIGEAGDLSRYGNPGKLWKRMGLAVFDGRAQRRVKDKAEAERQGFNPARRAVMHVIGDSLIKKENRYRDLYLARKEVEAEKLPDGSKMHIHLRALRYMEKRLLRDLWNAWTAPSEAQS